jgi:hypothetical protein
MSSGFSVEPACRTARVEGRRSRVDNNCAADQSSKIEDQRSTAKVFARRANADRVLVAIVLVGLGPRTGWKAGPTSDL